MNKILTFLLSKPILFFIIILLFLTVFPIILQLYFIPEKWNGYWGNYVGGIIGGSLTLFGVWLGIEYEASKRLKEHLKQKALQDIGNLGVLSELLHNQDLIFQQFIGVLEDLERRNIPFIQLLIELENRSKKCIKKVETLLKNESSIMALNISTHINYEMLNSIEKLLHQGDLIWQVLVYKEKEIDNFLKNVSEKSEVFEDKVIEEHHEHRVHAIKQYKNVVDETNKLISNLRKQNAILLEE